MENKNEIAIHEIGHFVALHAAGVYDEFTSISANPTIYKGLMVEGLTTKSGQSLSELSRELSDISFRMVHECSEAVKDEFKELQEKAKLICLPQLVFFFGGGAIDKKNGTGLASRNIIDETHIKNNVLPAMFVSGIDNEAFEELRLMVYDYLSKVFDVYAKPIAQLKKALAEHPTIVKRDMDGIVKGWDEMLDAENIKAMYDDLVVQYGKWLEKHITKN